jgi:hypothetical protein
MKPARPHPPAEHPSQTRTGAALVAHHEPQRRRGETNAALWERVVREALSGRSRREATALLVVPDTRTVARWVAWLAEHGGAPVGAFDRQSKGTGARGGTSPATLRRKAKEGGAA